MVFGAMAFRGGVFVRHKPNSAVALAATKLRFADAGLPRPDL
jgi:hypothetical protein